MSSVLLIDGDNLLTIGFYGVKNKFHNGKHFGAIFHFLNTMRKFYENHKLEKIVVFWDGENASDTRRKFYSEYKSNRKQRNKTEEEIDSYLYQRNRVKQYLEELYVRQGEFKYCETDDCIAYYVENSNDEIKIIYSSDADLTQLVSKDTKLYNPSHKKLYEENSFFSYAKQEVLIENISLIKTICGDPSDNIAGIRNMGIVRLLNLIPDLRNVVYTVDKVIEKFNLLHEQDKHNKLINNLLTGVTKRGVFGDEFFQVNNMIVNLKEHKFLTDEAKEGINQLINETLDPEGRSYKNTMRMMMEDGVFTALPKSDDALINFLNPFLRLARKEKNKKIGINTKIKIKNNE